MKYLVVLCFLFCVAFTAAIFIDEEEEEGSGKQPTCRDEFIECMTEARGWKGKYRCFKERRACGEECDKKAREILQKCRGNGGKRCFVKATKYRWSCLKSM
ncbi:uncharacterized protein [Clytia hemisphaerica]|uniref:Uncharacterized protein n=1 Tax=Clytia hemisphaerica TaxID=252671 RepID=A0A7M5WM06_9CNID